MGKDIKIIIGAILLTFLMVAGFAFWQTRQSQKVEEASTKEVQGITSEPDFFDLGNVPINGGIVAKEYKIKNTTSESLHLSKIVTSCMCTTAKIKIDDKETRYFGMEMAGDKNPPVNFSLAPGKEALVTVNFDPAAHGPQGIGPFDRIVWLYFTSGFKQLKFAGTVVN